MVSSEGACAAYYNFGRLSKVAEAKASNGEGKSLPELAKAMS
jgi:hypothetical protein